MLARQFYQHNVPTFLSIIQDPNLCISYSQLGEDTLIVNWISQQKCHKFSKYYVDIGAFHPDLYSNTKLLSLMGWKGINVDPNPLSINIFEKERPQDINLNLGIAERKGVGELFFFQEGAINTFSVEMAKKWVRQGRNFIGKHRVELLPINELLDTYLPSEVKESQIGFLDIDCEGLDREIILDLDLNRYQPYIIAVEAHAFDLISPSENEIVRFLTDYNYKLAAYTGLTLLFKRQTQKTI